MVGHQVEIDILNWDFDEQNSEHLARHDVEPADIYVVWQSDPAYFLNLPGRIATHIMIGRDASGRTLYVPILETQNPGTWRAVTGWQSSYARRLYDARKEDS